MTSVTAPALLTLTLLMTAACDTTPSGTASETSAPAESPTPTAVAPSPGEVRLTLTTHCGVREAEVDGEYWMADPPLGNGNAPPGWGNPETEGRWQRTSQTTAVFLADSGVAAAFVRAERPDPYEGCQ